MRCSDKARALSVLQEQVVLVGLGRGEDGGVEPELLLAERRAARQRAARAFAGGGEWQRRRDRVAVVVTLVAGSGLAL